MGVYSASYGGPSTLSLYSYFSLSGLGLLGLYMLLTGSGEQFSVGEFLLSISPHQWSLLGIALCVGLSVGGAAWYVHPSPLSFYCLACLASGVYTRAYNLPPPLPRAPFELFPAVFSL